MGLFTGSDKDSNTTNSSTDLTVDGFGKNSKDLDSFSKYDEEISKSFKATENALKDVFNVSNSIATEFIDRSTGMMNDFKSFFCDRNDSNNDDEFLSDVKKLDSFLGTISGGLLSNPFSINYKPLNDKSTGYWAYPSPSSEIYDACKEKNGLSVWDEQGYWRCLFPRAIIPTEKLNKVLSKEDVLEDSSHEKGLFFQDFNKYLDWKSNTMKVLRLEKEKKLQEFQKTHNQNQNSTVNLDFDGLKKSEFDSVSSNQINKDKIITGTKEYVSTYESDGVKTESIKKYEYYDDGSSAVKEITKKFDKDSGNKPIIQEHTEEFPAKKTGWFWDNTSDDQ